MAIASAGCPPGRRLRDVVRDRRARRRIARMEREELLEVAARDVAPLQVRRNDARVLVRLPRASGRVPAPARTRPAPPRANRAAIARSPSDRAPSCRSGSPRARCRSARAADDHCWLSTSRWQHSVELRPCTLRSNSRTIRCAVSSGRVATNGSIARESPVPGLMKLDVTRMPCSIASYLPHITSGIASRPASCLACAHSCAASSSSFSPYFRSASRSSRPSNAACVGIRSISARTCSATFPPKSGFAPATAASGGASTR